MNSLVSASWKMYPLTCKGFIYSIAASNSNTVYKTEEEVS